MSEPTREQVERHLAFVELRTGGRPCDPIELARSWLRLEAENRKLRKSWHDVHEYGTKDMWDCAWHEMAIDKDAELARAEGRIDELESALREMANAGMDGCPYFGARKLLGNDTSESET